MIGLNEYWSAFPGEKERDKIGEMELNGIVLKSMPNGRSKKADVPVFYCEYITKKAVNIFDIMEIAEDIMKLLCKILIKLTSVDDNCSAHRRQIRGKAAPQEICSETGKRAGKRNERYVDNLRNQ